MRFSLFNLSLLLSILCILTTTTTATETYSVKIPKLDQSNFTLYQYEQRNQYNFNTAASTDESVASSLRRKFVLEESSTSTHASKDPIFALVIFVALSSLLF